MDSFPIFRLSDNLLIIGDISDPDAASGGLFDEVSQTFVNDATCSIIAIRDAAGTMITGITFPIPMTYAALSNGVYHGTVSKEAIFSKGQEMRGEVRAVTVGGTQRTFFLDLFGEED